MERYWGYTEAEALGRHFAFIFTSEDQEQGLPEAELRGARAQGHIEDERWHQRQGGERFWASGILSALTEAEGRVSGFVKILRDMTERQRAEAAQRESAAKYHHLFEAIDAGFCIVEVLFEGERPVDYRFLETNPAFTRHTGIVDGGGRRMRDLAPDHEEHWFEIYGQVATTGEPVRLQRPAEALGRVFDVYAFRVGVPDQRRVAILFNDITEKQRAETALRESELRYRTLVEATNAVTWSCPPSGLHVKPQPAWMAFTGQSAEEMLGAGWTKAVHPDDRAVAATKWTEAVERGEPFTNEQRVRRHDGQWRWMHVQVAPIRDAAGRIVEWIGMNLDITERKRAEEALASAKTRAELEKRSLEAVLKTLPVGVIVTDAEGGVVVTNGRDEDIWGPRPPTRSVEDYAQYRAWWADSGQPLGPHEWASARAVREGESVIGQILEIERFDGGRRYVHNSAVPIRDERGQVMGCAVAIQDITDLRRAEEALRLADRRKDAFLATLGHELRNPLAPIRNACAILALVGRADPSVVAARELIDRQVSHLVRLVDDLLDVSRITRDKLRMQRECIELATVLGGALEVARPGIDAAAQTLEVTLPPSSIVLDADPTRLAQVFANLLNNASKFTPSGGSIRLAVIERGAEVVVEVTDTGCGIPAEHLAHLFELFYQVPGDAGRLQSGLGIGLALAQGIVAMHGGRITAQSAGSGQGSTFAVTLPIAAAQPLAPAPTAEAGQAAEHISGRVLVVDDQVDVAESLATLLRLQGIEVQTASDGIDALDTAARFHPDLVLLDLEMPRLDGFETCHRLRNEPWGRSLTIIAVTGLGQENARARSAAAGFDAHWIKPVDPAAILEQLVSLCAGAESHP